MAAAEPPRVRPLEDDRGPAPPCSQCEAPQREAPLVAQRPAARVVRLPEVSQVAPTIVPAAAWGATAAPGGATEPIEGPQTVWKPADWLGRPAVVCPDGTGQPYYDAAASATAWSGEPACDGRLGARPAGLWLETWHDIRCDYRNYYTWPTACRLLWGVAGASLLANTSLDQDFRDWYQDDVRSSDTDNFASFWKTFGEGHIFIPAYAGLALAGKLLDDVPVCGTVGEFSMRTTRAYLVGAPPMLFMQYLLGGSRPGETGHDSMWRPFEDNNAVSGHAFIGAVPFITAAKMCEHRLPRAGFYILSTFPAWSRVNDDAHYLSQVCLGWWMAYLACSSIEQTEIQTRCGTFTVVPVAEPKTLGAMAIWRR